MWQQHQRKKKAGMKSKKDNSSSDSSRESDDNESTAPKKKTAAHYIIELQSLHACATHPSNYCLVWPNGEHYQLTKQDLIESLVIIAGLSFCELTIA